MALTDSQFMKAYTIKEVSKMITVPSGTLRQWEKDLAGLLVIPRTKQGARFYTEMEIELLRKIKQMRDKNLSKEMIRDLMQRHVGNVSEPGSESFETQEEESLDSGSSSSLVASPGHGDSSQMFMDVMDQFKQNLLQEVKAEIKYGIRKEVLEDVKKEISKGVLSTVKTISDSIYKSGENTADRIKELSAEVARSSEHTSEEFKILADYVSNSNEATHQELASLNDVISQERDYFVKSIRSEREEYRKEIKQRDDLFKGMVESFRESAAAKQAKSWWQVWK